MPTVPQYKILTNSSVKVLNAIRNAATQTYKDYVPIATEDAECIREIGSVIMDMPALQNEFVSALINRIGKVIVTSKMYQNPWSMFKKGVLEFGETIEDIFVELAKPFEYDPAVAEEKMLKRQIPNIRSTFYVMNYQKYYKDTIEKATLRKAFLSIDGVTDLIAKIVESMYTSANYDEFNVMKYMLAKRILKGLVYAKAFTGSTASSNVTDIKAISNDLTFMKTKYNLAHVHTHTLKEDQYVILNTAFDANVDVNVLASAFNMDKAQFMGKRVLVDGFGDIDNDRLALLFANDPTYTELSDDEMTALNAIPCVIVDKDFFMVFDNFTEFSDFYNGEALGWQYWYHVWKTFAVSPFANAVVFIPYGTDVKATAVTVSPSTAVLAPGSSMQFTATVTTTGYADESVTWSVVDGDSGDEVEGVTIDRHGFLTIASDAVYADGLTVTATSNATSNVKGTASVSVPEDDSTD